MSDAIGAIKGAGIPDPGGTQRTLREGRAEHLKDGRNLAAMPGSSDSALPAQVAPLPEVSPHGAASTYRVAANEEGRSAVEEGPVHPRKAPSWELTSQEERELRALRRQESEVQRQDLERQEGELRERDHEIQRLDEKLRQDAAAD